MCPGGISPGRTGAEEPGFNSTLHVRGAGLLPAFREQKNAGNGALSPPTVVLRSRTPFPGCTHSTQQQCSFLCLQGFLATLGQCGSKAPGLRGRGTRQSWLPSPRAGTAREGPVCHSASPAVRGCHGGVSQLCRARLEPEGKNAAGSRGSCSHLLGQGDTLAQGIPRAAPLPCGSGRICLTLQECCGQRAESSSCFASKLSSVRFQEGKDLQFALAQLQQAAAFNQSRLTESTGWEGLEVGRSVPEVLERSGIGKEPLPGDHLQSPAHQRLGNQPGSCRELIP